MNAEKDSAQAAQEAGANGARHGQIHAQIEEHYDGHYHGQREGHAHLNQANCEHSGHAQRHGQHCARAQARKILAVRSHSGVSGDMLLAGFAALCLEVPDADAAAWLNELAGAIMPELKGALTLARHNVGGIAGWQAQVSLPEAHEHRHLADIESIIAAAKISAAAKERARTCFALLAEAEGKAHGIAPEQAHFHEVGALDSILDVCAVCELWARLGEPAICASPLPVADGAVHCAHGILPAPAPAVLHLLRGIPVRPHGAYDELLTPTGVALLRALGARFGLWPKFRVQSTAIAYGQRQFPDTPNGIVFALGLEESF